MRLGWRPIEAVEISLVGQNLQASNHDEWGGEANLFASEGAAQLLREGRDPLAVRPVRGLLGRAKSWWRW